MTVPALSLRQRLARLRTNISGLALTEFALSMPFLMTAGLWGTETANFAVTNMKVSQLTEHIADNASRIGDTSTLEQRKIYESDMNDLLLGAQIQAGPRFGLYEHGRVIISSLESFRESDHCKDGTCAINSATEGQQFIHWQRCMGQKNWSSNYGVAGNIMADGIGPDGEEVSAPPGEAVIFVEVAYDYQPLIGRLFIGNSTIRSISTFMVRDSRDLLKIYQRNEASPDRVANCSSFTDFAGTAATGGAGGGGGGGSSGSSGSTGSSSSSTTTGSTGSTSTSTSSGATGSTGSTGSTTTSTSSGTTGSTGSTTTSTSTTTGSTGSTSTSTSSSGGSSSGGRRKVCLLGICVWI